MRCCKAPPFLQIAKDALVAQLDRAPDYESGGREFESSRARHFFKLPDIQPAHRITAQTGARYLLFDRTHSLYKGLKPC